MGDAKWEKAFVPHVQLKRWGGECSLALWLQEPGDLLEISEHRIRWGNNAVEVAFYPTAPRTVVVDTPWGEQSFDQCREGGFEVNITLMRKPSDNIVVLPIETEGLKFYYQPPLHPEHPTWFEKDGERSACPENVVGSYAVYHATRGNVHTWADGEKYRCGKAFHVYRPRIVDAAGNAVWGDLNIDESAGLMVVEIPWEFLASAVYPVCHAAGATFGYESKGALWFSSAYDRLIGSHFACPEAGTADRIYWYSGSSMDDNKLGIYKYLSLIHI